MTPLLAAIALLPTQTANADAIFRQGKFPVAKALYSEIVRDHPRDVAATRQLGYIAMLGNDFPAAERLLARVLQLKPGDGKAKLMLAETLYRQDKFVEAAPLLRNLDKATEAERGTVYPSLKYAKLASFKGLKPYDVRGPGQSTTIKLLTIEPLPLLHVRINGSKDLTFFIDTGAAEVTLDPALATKLGVPTLGTDTGTFSGGMKMAACHGRIKFMKLGDWEIRNLPTQMLDLKPLAAAFGRRIDGIIGTMLFYHFITTLDYPKQELTLNLKTPQNRSRILKHQPGDISLPIWLAGDHFAVTPGSINGSKPYMVFVDTGYIGGIFKAAPTTLKLCDLVLDTDQAEKATGAGGGFTMTPFKIKEFALGEAKAVDGTGTFEGVFPWENTYGFFLSGMTGQDFFRPYAMTFDYVGMKILLRK
ncbi:MAG: aspartyl protease family protein [Fimbriimonadaceae bacterium]|nr:aspartyl protease family protein [Fimbriimonadaceae bacterium]